MKLNSPKQVVLPILILIIVAAGCSLPTASAPGPRAWIDFPLDGSTVELAPVVVYSHASDPAGVAELELYIDGAVVRVDAANSGDPSLAAFEQVWTPPGNGEYVLQVRAKNSAGNYGSRSNLVHLTIGDVVADDPAVPAESGVCPATDASSELYTNTVYGFCFLFPNDHSDQSGNSQVAEVITTISGPPVTDGTVGLTTSFSVSVEDAQGRDSSQYAADKISQAQTPGTTPATTNFSLDGEGAVWTEELGSLAGARNAYLVHNGIGYTLTLIPNGGDATDLNTQAQLLWTKITQTWIWFDAGPPPTAMPTPTSTAEVIEEGDAEATFHTQGFCRRGPSTGYDTLTGFEAGTVVNIDGRNASEPRWWWVLIPNTNGHCWISDSVVDVTGPVDNLPVIAAPLLPTATPTGTGPPAPTAPAGPTGLMFTSQVCDGGPGGGLTVTISWNDNANNENGYRVYRDGVLVATLSANTTSYSEEAPNKASGTNYYVEAYNAQGATSSATITSIPCPIG